MIEVTYYYDDYYTSKWSYPARMRDGSLSTFAYESTDEDWTAFEGTTCDGIDLGTITKVELRAYGYGDGNDRIDLAYNAYPISEYELTMPSSEGWSEYVDVTNDPDIDGWSWAKVATPPLYLYARFDKVAKGNTIYCAKVEIRVTYTPGAPPVFIPRHSGTVATLMI